MRNAVIVGWAFTLIGAAMWVYGYYSVEAATFISWQEIAPSWFAEYLPNRAAEIGVTLMIVALLPMYWPRGRSLRVNARPGTAIV